LQSSGGRAKNNYYTWPIEKIIPNPGQPRHYFDDIDMAGLAASIKEEGVLEPLKVTAPNEKNEVMLIDGERRLRAAQKNNIKFLPVIFKDVSDPKIIFRISVVSNFCRTDMTEIEIAYALYELISKQGYSRKQVADMTGKSEGWVAQKLKYLKLDDSIVELLATRRIAPAVALSLASYPKESQAQIMRQMIDAIKEKGRPFTPQEASLAVVRFSEKLNVRPVKPKKGREQLSFTTRLALKISKASERVSKDIDDLMKNVSDTQLAEIGGANLSLLEESLKKLGPKIKIVRDRLQKVD